METIDTIPHKYKYKNPRNCPVIYALSYISGKWKPLVFWAIMNGNNRFGVLFKNVPDISKRMLTKVLRELEADGLIKRQVFAEVPPRVEYSLTKKGESFIPIMREIQKWGMENSDE